MAANYWDSTQSKYWTFSKAELAHLRQALSQNNQALAQKYPLPSNRALSIFLQTNILKLARRLGTRQQPIATAQIYVKRFYLRVDIRKTNPYLIMTTAVYLACKTEESPQHIRLMLGEAARQWPELGTQETSRIGECEFALISTLQSKLILHHPYRTLQELGQTFGLSGEESGLAGNIINDSYCTDLPLLYPPHIIAVAAVFLAVVLRPAGGLAAHSTSAPASPGVGANLQAFSGSAALSDSAAQSAMAGMAGLKQAGPKLGKMVEWLAESAVDMDAIVDATQELVSLYAEWESYSERGVRDAISRFARENGGLGK